MKAVHGTRPCVVVGMKAMREDPGQGRSILEAFWGAVQYTMAL